MIDEIKTQMIEKGGTLALAVPYSGFFGDVQWENISYILAGAYTAMLIAEKLYRLWRGNGK